MWNIVNNRLSYADVFFFNWCILLPEVGTLVPKYVGDTSLKIHMYLILCISLVKQIQSIDKCTVFYLIFIHPVEGSMMVEKTETRSYVLMQDNSVMY